MTKIIVFANFNPVRFLGKATLLGVATKRGRLQLNQNLKLVKMVMRPW